MRHRLLSLMPAIIATTVAFTAAADGYDVVGKPELGFTAVGPGGLKINGTSSQLTTIEQGDSVVFKAALTGIKTGIGLRDNHTKRYLDTEHWPDASLAIAKGALKLPEDGKKTGGSVPGKFRLHGVTRDVKVAYTIERHGGDYLVDGHFTTNIIDHKIEKPCYLGVCVDEHVKVNAKFKLHAK